MTSMIDDKVPGTWTTDGPAASLYIQMSQCLSLIVETSAGRWLSAAAAVSAVGEFQELAAESHVWPYAHVHMV